MNEPELIASKESLSQSYYLKQLKQETWKNSGLSGNRAHDLCDTGAGL